MRKHTHRIIYVAIICMLCLSGCDLFKITTMGDDIFFTGKYNSISETDKNEQYKWLINPSIPASNIIVPDFSQINSSLINRYFLNIAVIYADGQYGFIDYNGSMLIEPYYDNYYICPCGEIILYNTNDGVITESCTLDSYGQPVFNAQLHEDNTSEYFWDIESKKLYTKKKNEFYATEYNGIGTVVAEQTNVTKIDYNTYSVPTSNDPVYALFKDGCQITEFSYNDYYAPALKSTDVTAIALKSNDKWGYVDTNGDEIIPFNCEGILSAFNGSANDFDENVHPYLYSENFIPVCINSNFLYYDLKGNCVISEGEFEQARPVVNGKAWVKHNGKWGIIQLGEIKEVFISTTVSTLSNYNDTQFTTSTSKSISKTSTNKATTKTSTNAHSSVSTSQNNISSDIGSESTTTLSTTTEQTNTNTENTVTIEQ